MTAVIETVGLGKKYGKNPALTGVTVSVHPGETVGLIGPNGAGKTTLLRMLADIIRPTSGSLTVLGHDPRNAPALLRERLGYLPGELKMSTRQSVRQVLNFFAEVSGPVPPGAIENWAERFSLDLAKPINDLSKGNKQKVGLIQALMHSPELLILDEPTSGLDPLIQREFSAVLREIKQDGRTVLLSSHVLGEIQQSADRVIVLSGGRVVADGPTDTLALTSYRRVRIVVANDNTNTVLGVLERSGLAPTPSSTAAGETSTAIEFSFTGAAQELIRTLSGMDLRDLTITEPDLEEAVLRLYDGDTRSEEANYD